MLNWYVDFVLKEQKELIEYSEQLYNIQQALAESNTPPRLGARFLLNVGGALVSFGKRLQAHAGAGNVASTALGLRASTPEITSWLYVAGPSGDCLDGQKHRAA